MYCAHCVSRQHTQVVTLDSTLEFGHPLKIAQYGQHDCEEWEYTDMYYPEMVKRMPIVVNDLPQNSRTESSRQGWAPNRHV